jgi:endonuclease/exonuclease/phosphatase (EEP) superfamily protein YafD
VKILNRMEITSPETPIPEESLFTPKITVASFNLLEERDADYINDVAEEMKDRGVDVVSIQGCNKLNREHLFRSFKHHGYSYTRFDQLHTRSSGEILFHLTTSNHGMTIAKKEYSGFSNSSQGRGVSKYLVTLGKQSLWIITSQLEENGSGNGNRKAQITEIGTMFSISNNPVIFVGDTNIPSWQDLGCPKGWLDGWREKGTSDNEKTTLLDRMDRVWYKGDSLECLNYSLICEFSERKGVLATFQILDSGRST